jgi:hypothetical protein
MVWASSRYVPRRELLDDADQNADQHPVALTVISVKCLILLVPGRGFEPLTNGLQNRCSTAELTRLYWVFRGSLATLASGKLAENRPGVLIPFEGSQKAASKISAALASALPKGDRRRDFEGHSGAAETERQFYCRQQRGAGRGLSLLGAPSRSPASRSSPRRRALFADAGRLAILSASAAALAFQAS